MVGAIGVEPTTPTVSRWCSATELRANKIDCTVDEEAYNSLPALSQQGVSLHSIKKRGLQHHLLSNLKNDLT
jgi:hypothetical protein